MKKHLIIVSLILVAIGVASRLLPHLANIAPIGALALFAGAYLPKKWGFAVPLIAMLISDLVIGFDVVPVTLTVYASFALMLGIGFFLRKHFHPLTIGAGSLAGSTIFFLTTNFATWAATDLYPHTVNGLMWAYTMGLPFFKWTVVGDLAWSVALFGGYAVAYHLVKKAWPAPLSVIPEYSSGIHKY